uniref:cell division cycle protein 123 homolog isoform X2 n=1 Tax=Podarcis muralis TaxID=64176 RepID=UPI00109F17EC|nr:cell division cycle protein 123 homolog isoform X2 [Podarcis muralis]
MSSDKALRVSFVYKYFKMLMTSAPLRKRASGRPPWALKGRVVARRRFAPGSAHGKNCVTKNLKPALHSEGASRQRDEEGASAELSVLMLVSSFQESDHPQVSENPLSIILPLPQNVKDYLLDDGTLVVSGREDPPTCSQEDDDGEEAEEIQWSDDENTTTLTAPEFPEFALKVEEAIGSLGGSVFPKLNWSAPRDAYWIALNSSLKCKCLSDIFLLFKSSDFITRDFTQPFIHCNDDSPDPNLQYELVLRKWCELIPGAEFRCFVKENKLIVVFDIYRDSMGRVWLIDFNPFGEVTDSLLFMWEELRSGNGLKDDESEGGTMEQDYPSFRCTNSSLTVQPSPYLSYRLPKDFVDLSTGEDVHKLIDLLKLKRNQQDDEES